MGILVPGKALGGGGKPAIGALTGLFQGLAQGIPIAEQLRNSRARTELAGREVDLREGEIGRRNAREDASKKAAALLAQFGSMAPGAAGFGLPNREQGQAGESGNAAPLPGSPSGSYGPLAGPEQAQPQGPQLPAAPQSRLDWLHQQLSNPDNGFSMEDTHQILEAAQRDEHLHAVNEHADRILGALQEGQKQGAFQAVDKFGNPDQSGDVAAQSIFDEISRADRSDPQHMAALLDKAEAGLREIKMAGAQKQSMFEQRQRQDQMFQNDRAMRSQMPQTPGQPDVASSEMDNLYNMWQRGLIDDKQMAEGWQDAKNGTFALKQQMNQMAAELQRYKMQEAVAGAEKARQEAVMASPRGQEFKSALDERRQINVAKARGEAKGAGTPAKPESANSKMMARKRLSEIMQTEYPDLDPGTPAYEAQKRKVMEEVGMAGQNGKAPAPTGGGEDASSFLDRIRTGEFDTEEELRKALEEAGLTEEDIHAAAGGR